jgi:hypothetical protein
MHNHATSRAGPPFGAGAWQSRDRADTPQQGLAPPKYTMGKLELIVSHTLLCHLSHFVWCTHVSEVAISNPIYISKYVLVFYHALFYNRFPACTFTESSTRIEY